MPLLKVENVSRSFGATRALAHADLQVSAGEIVALMGANGAGKSTLVNILSGVFPADGGTIRFKDEPFAPQSPSEAAAAGIATVHQSMQRVGAPGLSVADVLLLNRYADGSEPFFLTRSGVKRRAQAILDSAGFDLPLDRDFADLPAATRQLVAIARALANRASLLILDEPTASLSGQESARLYDILLQLKAKGLAILYISHRIADLKALADRVVVMRSGKAVGNFERPIQFEQAVELMIGRKLSHARPGARTASGTPVFEMRDIRLLQDSQPFDLSLHKGEVVAITGVLGAGKSRLMSAIFGISPLVQGRMFLNGTSYKPVNPRDAIAAGVAMAAEDRHQSSLMPADWPGSTLAQTISLPHLAKWFPSGFLFGTREQREAESAIHRLHIRTSGPSAPISTLSGGNQQKVVLARWEAEPSALLLLDEPFQGVDTGARSDIIRAIRSRTDRAVLIATSDPEEALEVADRILVIDHHSLISGSTGQATNPDWSAPLS
ncbi:sugar ABC transporter ATP-binding protein (plasmid) [Phyllobacterium sp. 628]|uniref:sugar ABC transporter ATP-binding protein n=1 Tax=Phyllobacterium sp. 628 TaxID=2718938 RepID=UPI001662273D|nr:sugar ABC transporter ATP-binding protein [Phyllobacterium sp. 628]QND55189.1 sugar ABC transporter ATP-binding protein [Phyllobacterium sp. 628]